MARWKKVLLAAAVGGLALTAICCTPLRYYRLPYYLCRHIPCKLPPW